MDEGAPRDEPDSEPDELSYYLTWERRNATGKRITGRGTLDQVPTITAGRRELAKLTESLRWRTFERIGARRGERVRYELVERDALAPDSYAVLDARTTVA